MLKATISGTLPEIEEIDFSDAMKKIGEYMVKSIQRTFLQAGRPEAWVALRGVQETPLISSGRLFKSINFKADARSVEISTGSGIPYARIHQFGGRVPISDKSRGFFWFMFKQTGAEKWKYMALSKQASFKIPARPYMEFQDSDIVFIKETLLGHAYKLIKSQKI